MALFDLLRRGNVEERAFWTLTLADGFDRALELMHVTRQSRTPWSASATTPSIARDALAKRLRLPPPLALLASNDRAPGAA